MVLNVSRSKLPWNSSSSSSFVTRKDTVVVTGAERGGAEELTLSGMVAFSRIDF